MPDTDREREWLDSVDQEASLPGLPRPDLNPLVNPLLGEHMGRWAEVYFTSPPEEREQAVENLIKELQAASAEKPPTPATEIAAEIKVDRAAAAPAPQLDAEPKAHELPMPQFTRDKPQPLETAEHDIVNCPRCLHKNAAEQRFCGICGFSLTQEPFRQPIETQTAKELRAPSVARAPYHPESDWRWVQQGPLSHLEATDREKSGSRFLIAVLFVGLFALGGYVVWQNRDRLLEQPARASSPASAEQAPVSRNVPTIATPTPAAPTQVVTTPNTNSPAETPSSSAPQQATPPMTTAESPRPPSPDDGRDELDQGRRYFQGEGVPRNSFMASQWLWKAVAKQNSDAVLLLSDLYARGDGVPRSCEQARVLLVAAAKKGSPAAAVRLRSIESSCR